VHDEVLFFLFRGFVSVSFDIMSSSSSSSSSSLSFMMRILGFFSSFLAVQVWLR